MTFIQLNVNFILLVGFKFKLSGHIILNSVLIKCFSQLFNMNICIPFQLGFCHAFAFIIDKHVINLWLVVYITIWWYWFMSIKIWSTSWYIIQSSKSSLDQDDIIEIGSKSAVLVNLYYLIMFVLVISEILHPSFLYTGSLLSSSKWEASIVYKFIKNLFGI